MPKSPASSPLVWSRFQEVIDPALLNAPRLNWSQFDRKLMYFLNTSVAEMPWLNHLAFFAAVSLLYAQLDLKTVKGRFHLLHCRFKTIFSRYDLKDFTGWNPAEHMPRYLSDPDLEDSIQTRQEFLTHYAAATRSLQIYLHSLPKEEAIIYQQWAFPPLPAGMREQLGRYKEVREAQINRRKAESDAVTPHFGRIRGEAHMRWNEIHRLWQKFQEVVANVQAGQVTLPVAFSYDEPRYKQRLHFKLWDRASFVIAHANRYHSRTVCKARNQRESCSPEKNHYFLEFLGADSLREVDAPREPDALFWFGDLLRYGVLGRYAISGTAEEVQHKQAYLRSWGYGTEEGEEDSMPFNPDHPGLLAARHEDGTADFMNNAQKRSDGLVVLVESLFAAATFGLAALSFFTTTGARMTELLQLSLRPDCLYTMEVGGTQRLLVRLVPKGTDKPADYMVGAETRKNLERVGNMLKKHYDLPPGAALPPVTFHRANNRAHEFTDQRPYLFQYNGLHLSHRAITACMRFLCHGMVFQSTDGKPVVLKAHLLRHVFATHLHHVERVPLDVVAKILHQKDVRVTGYYAAPEWQQVVATTDNLLDRFATHLGNVEDAFVRAPEELQRQLEEAKQQVGALTKVIGGECTCYALCPISFACTGCIYKVPDYTRRNEIVEQRQWACIRLEQVKRKDLGPETANYVG